MPPKCDRHDDLIEEFTTLKAEVGFMREQFKKFEEKLDQVSNKIMVWSGMGMGIVAFLSHLDKIKSLFS